MHISNTMSCLETALKFLTVVLQVYVKNTSEDSLAQLMRKGGVEARLELFFGLFTVLLYYPNIKS